MSNARRGGGAGSLSALPSARSSRVKGLAYYHVIGLVAKTTENSFSPLSREVICV